MCGERGREEGVYELCVGGGGREEGGGGGGRRGAGAGLVQVKSSVISMGDGGHYIFILF